ncbi:MAG: (2Fe-2S)-binding protein [Porphyromonadaceae bacterium]|nr:(2Fe-2S)-binding protein [Porphyromonadaceae bacterium]
MEMDDDFEICHCYEVTRGELIKAIRDKELKTLEEVMDETEVGTMCGGCIPDVEDILAEIWG